MTARDPRAGYFSRQPSVRAQTERRVGITRDESSVNRDVSHYTPARAIRAGPRTAELSPVSAQAIAALRTAAVTNKAFDSGVDAATRHAPRLTCWIAWPAADKRARGTYGHPESSACHDSHQFGICAEHFANLGGHLHRSAPQRLRLSYQTGVTRRKQFCRLSTHRAPPLA